MSYCPNCQAEIERAASACVACGAVFNGASSWKPLSSTEPEEPSRSLMGTTLYLSFPIWGLVLLFALLSILPKGAQASGNSIILLGALAPLIGGVPIFGMSNQGVVAKALLFAAYYGACALVMFVVGWAALGIFGLAK